MSREQILNTAKRLTCEHRNHAYGEPVENMADIALLWSAYLYTKYGGQIIDPHQFHLTGEDVAWLNVLAKIARTVKSHTPDNYIDAAAYAAIAGECREAAEEE